MDVCCSKAALMFTFEFTNRFDKNFVAICCGMLRCCNTSSSIDIPWEPLKLRLSKMPAAIICRFSTFKSKFRGLLNPGFQDFTLCATNFDVRNLCTSIWRVCKDAKANACHRLHWKCPAATTNRRAAKGLGTKVRSYFKKTREGFMQEVFCSFLRSIVSHKIGFS